MKREILFKAQAKYNRQCVSANEWIYGFLWQDPSGIYFIHVLEEDESGNIIDEFEVQIIPETVCQFTGLFDSTKFEELTDSEQKAWMLHNKPSEWKGKRIFEGDVICEGDNEGIEYVCKWNDLRCEYAWYTSNGYIYPIGDMRTFLTLTGKNIHDKKKEL